MSAGKTRQRQRATQCDAKQAPGRIQNVEQREEVVLVGTSAVEQYQRAGRFTRRFTDAVAKFLFPARHDQGP
jgi:hypothetical protein